MDRDNNRKKQYVFGAMFITLALYFIFSITGWSYTYTDNITVGVVTSGMYGSNNMCQYLHPLYCLIIKFFNPILPTADVFALFTHLFLLLGVFMLSYAAIEVSLSKGLKQCCVEDYISFTAMLSAIAYFILGLKLFGINYTVQTSAILAFGIVVLFYSIQAEKGRNWIIGGTTLVIGGFLGRTEASLLFLPFIALDLTSEFIQKRKRIKKSKQAAKYLLPSLLAIILFLGSKALFLQMEPYKSDAEYNKYRTIVEDYPMETYGVTYKDFTGIDKETYNSAILWTLIDTDRINTEMLQKIAEAGSRNEYQTTEQGISWTLQEMKRQATSVDVHVMTLTALVVILTIWNLLAAKGIWLKLEALCSFLGGFIILFYFTFRGRAPLRVWQCVLIAALTTLALVMIKDVKDKTKEELTEGNRKQRGTAGIIIQLFLCVVLYFGIGQVLAHSLIHAPTSPLTAKIGADDSGYEETFSEYDLYIWPWWYSCIPDYFSKQDKLPTKRVIEHNIALGDWVYGQVYFRDFLKRIGAPNPALALLNRPNTYLMEGKEELVLNYMRQHYDKNLELVYSHKVNGVKAYKLVYSDTED